MITDTTANSEAKALLGGRTLAFLGGLHRSGTSLIHRCLSDHTGISGFSGTGVPEDEGQHLQSVYLPAAKFGGPGLFGFEKQSHMDEHSPLAEPANAARLMKDWTRYWDMSRSVLIEKSPPNLVRSRFLQALFPSCRFIMVLRHPIAVAYATQKWTPVGVWVGSLIEHWLVCHEKFEADRPMLKNVHVLRYEDFVAQPQKQLDAMFAFLGVESQPFQRKIESAVNDRYFATWRRRRSNPLSRMYMDRVVRKYQERVQGLGYSLEEPL